MKNRSKDLYVLLIKLNILLNRESENVYNLLSKYLQEQSHSFGFKPFSDLSEELVLGVDLINNNENFQNTMYEYQNLQYSEDEKYILNQIYNKKIDKTEELLTLILNLNKKLYDLDKSLGKDFSLFLTENLDCSEKTLFSFSYTNKIIEFLENELDINVYSDINYVDSYENKKDVMGWFYWFCCENNFGTKELQVISSNEKINNYKINNYETFFELIKEEENFLNNNSLK